MSQPGAFRWPPHAGRRGRADTAAPPARSLRRRLMGLLAGTTSLALAAAGCGGTVGGSDTVTIRFANWAAAEQTTGPGLQKVIDQYEKDNPGVQITMEPISFSDIANKMLLQHQSGNPPTIAEISGNDMLSLAAAGALADLGPYADEEFTSTIIPGELELGRVEGKLLAIPWTVAPFGLWYNKKLMAEAGLDPQNPPGTIEELDRKSVV